jgi:hypothetical protein
MITDLQASALASHGRFKIVLGLLAAPGWRDVRFCRDLVSARRA